MFKNKHNYFIKPFSGGSNPPIWRVRPSRRVAGVLAGVILALGGGAYIAAQNGWFGGGASIPEDTMTRGLVGSWSFDEGSGTTAYDASGNNNAGILAGGATWADGKDGSALRFDGKDDYVDCGTGSSLNITGDLTIEAWIRPDQSKDEMIVRKGGDGDATPFALFLLGRNLSMRYHKPVWGTLVTDNNNSVTIGVWQHITVTRSFNGTLATGIIYVNGKEIASGTLDGTPSSNSVFTRLGCSSTNTFNFSGSIDGVKIYDRALTAAEVKYHFNHGGPVGYWKFDEGSGSLAKDSSGNNNDGTISGASWTDGKYGSALNFDGTDDYLNCGDINAIDGVQQLTISGWVKADSLGPWETVFEKNENDSNNNIAMALDGQAPYKKVIVKVSNGGNIFGKSADIMDIDNWHHWTMVFDGTQTSNNEKLKLFFDGQQQALTFNGTVSAISNNNSAPFIIGRGTASYQFDGSVDDTKVYNYARTADEIRLDYQAGMAAHLGPSGQTCVQDPASCMDKGLVGYWDMDEGGGQALVDKSENKNNGTLGLNISTGSDDPKRTVGKKSGALLFDGENDFATVPYVSSFDGTFNDSDWAFSAWINPSSTGDSVKNIFEGGNGHKPSIRMSSTTFYIAAYIGGVYTLLCSAAAPAANTWSHVAVTANSSNIIMYVNGLQMASCAYQQIDWPPTLFRIGGRTDEQFKGMIDEVRVYNRSLSVEEVRYHYNQGGPVGYWKFDEGSGTKAKDASGNNNDGAISGATWADGKYGGALSFDGTDDYVSANLSSTLTGPATFGFWIRPHVVPNVNARIISKAWSDDEIYLMNGSGYMSTVALLTTSDLRSTAPLSINNWSYAVITADLAGSKLYINGKLDDTGSAASISMNSLKIGGQMTAYWEGFDGDIDDVKIYNYVRTAEEIRLDYQAGMAAHLGPSGQTCAQDPASCMSKGLVGYWDMNEGGGTTAKDKSGNGNNGTFVGDPKWTEGKAGSALSFDGKDDYADFGDSSSLNLTNAITVEFWVKRIRSVYEEFILDKSRYYTSGVRGWGFEHISGRPYFILQTTTQEEGNRLQAPTVMSLNKWYHVVGTWDGSVQKIYLNGLLENSKDVGGFLEPNGLSVKIGRKSGATSSHSFFNGLTDDVRIYNRALSAEEVRYHYNQGEPVGWWKMDDGKGVKAFDASGNNNKGILGDGACQPGSGKCPSWVAGKNGSALSFDGSDDYVNMGSQTELTNFSAKSFFVWINPIAYTGQFRYVYNNGYWASPYGDIMYLDANTNRGLIVLKNTAGTVVSKYFNFIPGQWTHVGYTWNGIAVNYYQDGKIIGTDDLSGILGCSGYNLYISNNTGQCFNGQIDDVKIYNYARSVEQVKTDYNAGVAVHLK